MPVFSSIEGNPEEQLGYTPKYLWGQPRSVVPGY